jgi:hypothetical protein
MSSPASAPSKTSTANTPILGLALAKWDRVYVLDPEAASDDRRRLERRALRAMTRADIDRCWLSSERVPPPAGHVFPQDRTRFRWRSPR